MSFHIVLSEEETFNRLVKYFVGRRLKILSLHKPSHIKVEIGKLFSLWFGEALGVVDINIMKLGNHSLVNLYFNFLREYISGLILSILLSFILTIYGLLIDAPWDAVLLLAITVFAIVMLLEGYNVAVTRKKFVEELSLFVQSINSNKVNINGRHD